VTGAPIGIFDSGVGGLTVARAILDQLPHEQVVYLGDTVHLPYGNRPIAEVRRLALGCLDQLVDQGVKMLVIACNTASAACLHDARERYAVPVIEVIRPAVRRAVAATRNGQVGVIGTASTINSGAYEDGFAAAPHVRVTSAACPQFVEFVERGVTSGRALLELAGQYLAPLQRTHVDTLVLGCTHYPLLAGMIGMVMGDGVTLVSSADETARAVYRTLTERDMFRADDAPPPVHSFASTGDAVTFARLAARFLGPEAAAAGAMDAAAGAVDAAAGTPAVAGPIDAAVLAGERA
jgi:glutamate racemase